MENNAEIKIKVGLRVPKNLYKKMKKFVSSQTPKWSMNQLSEVAIEKYLKRRKALI